MTTLERLPAPVEIKDLSSVYDLKIPTEGQHSIFISVTKEDLLRIVKFVARGQKDLEKKREKYAKEIPGARGKTGVEVNTIRIFAHGIMKTSTS